MSSPRGNYFTNLQLALLLYSFAAAFAIHLVLQASFCEDAFLSASFLFTGMRVVVFTCHAKYILILIIVLKLISIVIVF